METAFEHILENNSLKINSCSLTNDPYETKTLNPAYHGPPGQKVRDLIKKFPPVEIRKKILKIINSNTYLFCCSQDIKIHDEKILRNHQKQSLEGFWNFSQWNLYGNNHRGVCLTFDRALLNEQIMKNFQKDYIITNDEVDYYYLTFEIPDKTVPFWYVNIRELKDASDESIIEYFVNKYSKYPDRLHFVKDRTWEGEAEYRWVLFSKNPIFNNYKKELFVDYGKALKKIYLGINFSEKYFPFIKAYCLENDIELYKIKHSHDRFDVFDALTTFVW
jgi:hypothetical protein